MARISNENLVDFDSGGQVPFFLNFVPSMFRFYTWRQIWIVILQRVYDFCTGLFWFGFGHKITKQGVYHTVNQPFFHASSLLLQHITPTSKHIISGSDWPHFNCCQLIVFNESHSNSPSLLLLFWDSLPHFSNNTPDQSEPDTPSSEWYAIKGKMVILWQSKVSRLFVEDKDNPYF